MSVDSETIEKISEEIKHLYNFDFSFKKEQVEVIKNVINKKDVFCLLKTGFGKSVCFMLPSLILDKVNFQILLILVISISVTITTGEDTVSSIAKEFWEWRMSDSPAYSTTLGHYAYNDRVFSFNMSIFETRKNISDGFLLRLKQIDVSKLENEEKLNYDILLDTLETFTENYKWRYHGGLNPVNFLEGLHIFYTVGMASTRTRGDFENYIAQLLQVPKQVEEIIECFEEAIRRNMTYHRVSVENVPEQLHKMTTVGTRNSVFYTPTFNETLENAKNIQLSEKENIRARAEAAVQGLFNSFQRLSEYIKKQYLPNTRSHIGVSSLINGTDFYRACLRWHLSSDVTPEEVHKLGVQEVDRIHKEMRKIMKELNFEGSVKDFFASLNNNSNFVRDDADTIIEIYENIIHNRITPKLSTLFENIPNIPIKVQKMEMDGVSGLYFSATETSPGIFELNLHRPQENPTYEFMALAMHETFPGHHLQHIVGMVADLPPYRRSPEYLDFIIPYFFPYHSSFVEGWGLYAEYLGEEMGLYKDRYEMMGRYSLEILRACRMVVDTGMHVYNWSHGEAMDYLLNYTAYSREAIEIEVNRYITWPGQACSYKFGEMHIKTLRKHAEQSLGENFDVKSFHSVVLRAGAMPLSVLENIVDNWITRQLNKLATSSSSIQRCQLHILVLAIMFYGIIFDFSSKM